MSETQEAQTKEAAAAAEASGQGPPPEEVRKAVEAAQAAARFQDAADSLKKQAVLATDPVQREKLWTAAYMKEKEAHGESKKARIMASGWGQGAGLGIGISTAVGMGMGNVVGALLSGVVAIPGTLIGSGVGAIHGPWYKLKDMVSGGGEKKSADGDEGDETDKAMTSSEKESGEASEAPSEDEAHMAIVEAARQMDNQDADKKPDSEDGTLREVEAKPEIEAKPEGEKGQKS